MKIEHPLHSNRAIKKFDGTFAISRERYYAFKCERLIAVISPNYSHILRGINQTINF